VNGSESRDVRNLRIALSFLTRIPFHVEGVSDVSGATPWFPVTGALIGSAGAAVFVGAFELVPPGVAAALALVTTALITGAFHHDGLADIADAFGGGWTVEQRMVILKDSRHGTYGVVSLVLSGLVMWSSLGSLNAAWGIAAIIGAHTLARAAVLGVLLMARSAGSKGLGTDYAAGLPRRATWVGLSAGLVLGGALMGPWGAVAIAAVVLTTLAVVWLAYRKIGGFSGDVLGAVEQVGECAVLVVASAAAMRTGSPWWR
jgi:adenosylcobinamide-GDP ribazoletransferase